MIQTERLLLRQWKTTDCEPFARMNRDPRVMEFFPRFLSTEESDDAVKRLQRHMEQHGFTFFAAELRETGEFIGFVGIFVTPFEAHFTPCVEIGWRLDPAFWNRGLATEGARAVVRLAFQTLGLEELVALVVPANHRSRRVMEKLGMTFDPADDFDHPNVPEGPLRRHMLYRLKVDGRAIPAN